MIDIKIFNNSNIQLLLKYINKIIKLQEIDFSTKQNLLEKTNETLLRKINIIYKPKVNLLRRNNRLSNYLHVLD